MLYKGLGPVRGVGARGGALAIVASTGALRAL